jgi:hypothetical protein
MNLADIKIGQRVIVREPGEPPERAVVVGLRPEDDRQRYGVQIDRATWRGGWSRSVWVEPDA